MQSLADNIMRANTPRGVWAMLVGPYGEVRTLEVMPHIGGDVMVALDPDGEPRIPKRYREAGWCFYEQICSGECDQTGTDPGVGAAHLEAWHRVRDLFASGARPGRTAVDHRIYYHPEVWRRRALERDDGLRPVPASELFGDGLLTRLKGGSSNEQTKPRGQETRSR